MQGTNHRTSMRTTGGLLLVLLCATLGGAEEALSITDRLELAAFLLYRVCKREKDARFDTMRESCPLFLRFWVR